MVDSSRVFQAYLPGDSAPTDLDSLRFYLQNELPRIGVSITEVYDFFAQEIARLDAEKVQAGYGAIGQSAAPALPDITSGWQTLPADYSATAENTRGVSYDLANDALVFDEPGVWQLIIAITLSFTSANAGRSFGARARNIVDGAVSDGTTVYVARDADGINYSLSILLNVDEDDDDEGYAIQIGNASTNFTNVNLLDYRFDVVRVSEAR